MLQLSNFRLAFDIADLYADHKILKKAFSC